MVSSTAGPDLAYPNRKMIQSLFNAIPNKYDFLNSFLSLGLDRYWRQETVRYALGGLERAILDLGVGTGKSLAAFLEAHQFSRAVGCDFSEQMLQKGKERLGNSAQLAACDFHELPFCDKTFDLVTGSFILRSVEAMPQFLSEVKRVLVPGGKAVFLELTRPTNRLIAQLIHEPYLKFYVPTVGRLFSKHDNAYQFLSESVQTFMAPEILKRQFESAGFSEALLRPLSFGIVTVIEGKCGRAS